MERICKNIDCQKPFTLFDKYAKSNKPSKHFYCINCRKHPSKVTINCIGCEKQFQPIKLSQVYCELNCKVRISNRRAYNRNKFRRAKIVHCKFCNIEIPPTDVPRNRICKLCEEGFIKRLNDMKCMLCGVKVKSKMYCSGKCRAYSQLIISRNKKNDGVL